MIKLQFILLFLSSVFNLNAGTPPHDIEDIVIYTNPNNLAYFILPLFFLLSVIIFLFFLSKKKKKSITFKPTQYLNGMKSIIFNPDRSSRVELGKKYLILTKNLKCLIEDAMSFPATHLTWDEMKITLPKHTTLDESDTTRLLSLLEDLQEASFSHRPLSQTKCQEYQTDAIYFAEHFHQQLLTRLENTQQSQTFISSILKKVKL